MSHRPCTPPVTASPAYMCRRTLFDHSEMSSPPHTSTCLFDSSAASDDEIFPLSQDHRGVGGEASVSMTMMGGSLPSEHHSGTLRFPVVGTRHPSFHQSHTATALPRLTTAAPVTLCPSWPNTLAAEKPSHLRKAGACEEEEDFSWTRRSTFHDFSEDLSPGRPSIVMDEQESPTPTRRPLGGTMRGMQACFPSTSVTSLKQSASFSFLPSGDIADRPLRRGLPQSFGGMSGLALSREDDDARSQTIPFYVDPDTENSIGFGMFGLPSSDSTGTLAPQREDTLTFCSQGTLPPCDGDTLAATCSYHPPQQYEVERFLLDDDDDGDSHCGGVYTPRPTVAHTATANNAHSQATPSNRMSGCGYYSAADHHRDTTTTANDPLAGGSLNNTNNGCDDQQHPRGSHVTPRIPFAATFSHVMCTPQTSRVELEMRKALNDELEATNTQYFRVAPPLVNCVADRFFIGAFPGKETVEELRTLGVTHIINCCASERKPCEALCQEFKTGRVEAHDNNSCYIISDHMTEFRSMMHAMLNEGDTTKVFVHCAGGVNRSVALLAAFLCEHLHIGPVAVVRMLRSSGRHYILTNSTFREQLVEHYLHHVRTDLLHGGQQSYHH